MALTVADSRTILSTEDGAASNWDEGTTSDYITAEDGGREGTGFVGYDIDIETLHNFDIVTVIPADLSGNHYGRWLRITNPTDLDTKALGGIRLALRDGAGNESYWYVGGSDTYAGGWYYFICDLASTPDANNGSNAVITNCADLGVGGKCLAKTLNDNFQMDLAHYGVAGLVVTGTPDTGTYGTDKAMQELYDIVDTNHYGLIAKLSGVFVCKGSIQFNDDATGVCTFEDSGSTLVWDDLPVSASFYKFSLGSSTGISIVRFGTVVGSGDNRQGVNGGSIFDSGIIGWSIDFATNLGANASNNIKLYGINLSGAKAGLKFDDAIKTSIISAGIVNCGEVDLGLLNDGAELLNFSLIDPIGAVNNYGLVFNKAGSSTPLVTSGLVFKLDGDVGVVTSGTTVTAWNDQAGTNDLTAAGDPQEVISSGVNNHKVVVFDGTGDKVERSASVTGLPTGDADRTVFMVAKYLSNGFGGFAYGTTNDNQAYGVVVNDLGNLTVQGWGVGNDYETLVAGNGAGWLIQSAMHSSGALTHYKDNVEIDSQTHTFNTVLTEIVLGAEMADSVFLNMEVAYVLIYNRALTTQERIDVQEYLYNRFFAVATDSLPHNVKQGSFITSGVPTTQHMLRFPYDGDYEINMQDFVFYGDYTSGTLWHGLNSGLNANIVVNSLGATNISDTEVSNTNGGTVTVNASVPITITVYDEGTGLVIPLTAHVQLLLNSDKSVILSSATDATGKATAAYNYVGDVAVVGWVRQWDLVGDDYTPKEISGTITSTGLVLEVRLKPI